MGVENVRPKGAAGAQATPAVREELRGRHLVRLVAGEQVDPAELDAIKKAIGYDGPDDLAAIKEALRQWQASKGLLADGIVGDQTWAAIDLKRYDVRPGRRLIAALAAPAPAVPAKAPAAPNAAPQTDFTPAPATASRTDPVDLQPSAAAPVPPAQRASAAAPVAGRPTPPPKSNDPVVAKVGDAVIRDSEVQKVTGSKEREAALNKVLTKYADALNVQPQDNESADAFMARLGAAAKAAGKEEEIATELAKVDQMSQSQALLRLLAPEIAKQELAQHNRSLPPNADAKTISAELNKYVAETLNKPVDSQDVQDAVADLLTRAALDAVWDAHKDVLEPALERFPADQRAGAREFILGAYTRFYGLRAPEQLAKELAEGGPATHLLELLKIKPSASWSAWDLADVMREHPELKRWFPDPKVGADPLEAAAVGITFEAGPGGLQIKASRAPVAPLLQDVKSGKLRLALTAAGDIEVRDKTGKSVGSTADLETAASQLVGPLERLHKDLAAAWKAGKPLGDVIKASGLAPYFGDKPVDVALLAPGLAEDLKSQVLSDAVAGGTSDALLARAQAAGLPAAPTKELLDLQSRLKALQDLHPLPPQLKMISQGKSAGVKIPLTPNVKLSAEQSSALAAVQRYLDLTNESSPGAGQSLRLTRRYGEMDEQTLAQLRSWAPKGSNELTLDTKALQGLLVTAARNLDGKSTTSGEMILRHPVVTRTAGSNPKPDPVRLVVEYMRATGALGPADPPVLDADFYSA
ncbi:MAG TPA: peptidoglycan-binding domain-containing protein, partial [Myxococcaceae bacterium]|nr:peptidoglycan-binding domain-containing protein [Myxococcaceae bacterium]